MRILLDSNVWRYIIDADALPSIQDAARKSRKTIVVAPAVVYEALRFEDTGLRHALVSAMTLSTWKRLMPEAYSEAEEIKAEVKRLRPEWLRQPPDLTLYRRLRYDWKRSRGGFWDRARLDTEGERQRVDDTDLLEMARAQAQHTREEGKAMPSKWQSGRLTSMQASPSSAIPGWEGHPVELWRMDGLTSFRMSMSMECNPYVDWLDSEVDLTLMMFQSDALTHFWLHEVDLLHMPRQWLRTALHFLQRFHRVTDGTPADNQLGTYLLDVDLMLSADKNLVRILERCRDEAPFPIGRSLVVPGGPSAVDAVLSVLHT